MLAPRHPIEPLSDFECEYLDWYVRVHDTVGQPFDPRLCMQLARAQWRDRPQLAEAFARCTTQWPRREEGLYTAFMAPRHKAERWRFAGNLFLMHPEWGELLVDVIHDPEVPGGLAIGGIEYLDRVRRSVMAENRELYWPAGDAVPTSAAPPRPQLRIVHLGNVARIRCVHRPPGA